MFVHTDSRGTGHSPTGQWDMFGQEMQNDLYDMIEWIAVQAWCDGKVGMLGESLLAWSQWFTAVQQPPHLTCILPWDAGADLYRDVAWHGGMMAVGFPTAWNMWEIRGHYRLGIPERFGTPAPNPEMGKWDMVWNVMNHPTYDDFWKLRNPDFSKIQVPVFVVGALHKVGLHLRGVVRGYEELKTPKKMMLIHGVMDGDEMAIYNSPEMQLLMLRWYDHWLKGNDTGIMDEPPVSLFVRGADEYRLVRRVAAAADRVHASCTSTRPRAARWTRSTTAASPGMPPTRDTSSSFSYGYPDQDWTHFSGGGTAVIEENGVVYGQRRIPTFTSAPLDEDLQVIGQHRAGALRLVGPAEHRLLLPAGGPAARRAADPGHAARGAHPHPGLAQGVARRPPRARSSRSPIARTTCTTSPQPIEPGKIYKYEIEIWPTSNVFKKGHRIRIDVACGDSPALDFGGHYYGIKVGNDTYYHDKDHPSHVILPVIPR